MVHRAEKNKGGGWPSARGASSGEEQRRQGQQRQDQQQDQQQDQGQQQRAGVHLMMGVLVSSMKMRAVQSPMVRKYFGWNGLRCSE